MAARLHITTAQQHMIDRRIQTAAYGLTLCPGCLQRKSRNHFKYHDHHGGWTTSRLCKSCVSLQH